MIDQDIIKSCEEMKARIGYAPNPHCPVCRGSGFVHPHGDDGKPDHAQVISCQAKGCIMDQKRVYQSTESYAKDKGVSKFNNFDNFKPVLGAETTLEAFKDIAVNPEAPPLLMVYGTTGNGKCLAKGTKVVMATGELREVENIKEGDSLSGLTDKKIVSGVMRGFGSLYKVKQSHGLDYVVNGNHPLYLRKSVACAKAKGGRMPSGNWRRPRGRYPDYSDELCISVNEYLSKSNSWKRSFYGYRVGINLTYKRVLIDPYLLGLWLGDGDSNTIVITTADDEIKNYIYANAEAKGMTVSVYSYSGRAPRYRIKKAHSDGLTKLFKKYNLLGNKHVPPEYLYNSSDVRLSLLAGIIDTDGNLNTNCYEVIQKSGQLAKDIQYLCHSLGLRCSIKQTQKGIKNTGFVGDYYRLNISGEIQIIPVKIKRKMPLHIRKNKNPSLSSIKVDYIGEGDFYGFDLGGDGLFLLEDFTVTHNTHLCEATVIELLKRGIDCRLWTVPDLMSKLHQSIPENTTPLLMNNLKIMPALILDEWGQNYGSEWEEQKLEEVVLARERVGLITIVTSNLEPDKLPERIASRFRDKAQARLIDNKAPDYRPKKKAKRVKK